MAVSWRGITSSVEAIESEGFPLWADRVECCRTLHLLNPINSLYSRNYSRDSKQ